MQRERPGKPRHISNLGIRLSAPNTKLLKGQQTTLHVVVTGLEGIKQDVPLELVNNSPGVISMAGGEAQSITIHPSDVQTAGTYSLDRTLTGIRVGDFGITGTVSWEREEPPSERNPDDRDHKGPPPTTARDYPSDYEVCGSGCRPPVKKDGKVFCVDQTDCQERGGKCGCHLFGAPSGDPNAPWEHKADPGSKWSQEDNTEYRCSCVKKKK